MMELTNLYNKEHKKDRIKYFKQTKIKTNARIHDDRRGDTIILKGGGVRRVGCKNQVSENRKAKNCCHSLGFL